MDTRAAKPLASRIRALLARSDEESYLDPGDAEALLQAAADVLDGYRFVVGPPIPRTTWHRIMRVRPGGVGEATGYAIAWDGHWTAVSECATVDDLRAVRGVEERSA